MPVIEHNMGEPPSPYDHPEPEPAGPCGCTHCTPSEHAGALYCQSCDGDIDALVLAESLGMDWHGLRPRGDFLSLVIRAYNAA